MEASDNVMVTKVQIEIVDAEGKVLAQGEGQAGGLRLVGICYQRRWDDPGNGLGPGRKSGEVGFIAMSSRIHPHP